MNTPNHAKTFCPAPLAILSAAAACAIAGCSDPADKAAKTTAIEPKQIAQPTANAKDYILHAESKIESVGSKVTGSHAGGFKRIAGRVSVANGVVRAA